MYFHVSDLKLSEYKVYRPLPLHNTHSSVVYSSMLIKQLVSFSLFNKIVKADIMKAFVKLFFVQFNIETISILNYGQGPCIYDWFFNWRGGG